MYFIGCKDTVMAPILKDLIETDNFKVSVVSDVDTVEVCGALKVISWIPSNCHLNVFL